MSKCVCVCVCVSVSVCVRVCVSWCVCTRVQGFRVGPRLCVRECLFVRHFPIGPCLQDFRAGTRSRVGVLMCIRLCVWVSGERPRVSVCECVCALSRPSLYVRVRMCVCVRVCVRAALARRSPWPRVRACV
jgi:hypothetical protein